MSCGRAGYKVTVLEARDRIGGRVLDDPRRRPDRADRSSRSTSRPSIRDYISTPGPARIPTTHRVILGYARRFGVPLEPFINVNRNAGWDFGGKVHPERRMVNDMRGHISELLAKAIDRMPSISGTKEELGIIREFLGATGGSTTRAATPRLAVRLFGRGRGLRSGAGACRRWRSRSLRRRRRSGLPYVFENIWDMQATLLQPVGGMDRIAHAIYDRWAGGTAADAGHRHPPCRRRRADRAWPGQADDRSGLLHLHAAAAGPRANSE